MVPGANNMLTMAMVLKAVHDTPFTKPGVNIQPVGLKTLVNLPTYYEVTWPATGYGPDEINTTTLLGYQVQIRPLLKQLDYRYGDGSSSGPTTSLGGPHPTGDIVHTYTTAGTVPVSVSVRYGAEFRVNGGEWIPIEDTVDLTGASVSLQVLEARARLYR